MRYASFVIGRAAQSPVGEFLTRHVADFFWILVIIVALVCLGPGIWNNFTTPPQIPVSTSEAYILNDYDIVQTESGEWIKAETRICNVYSSSLQIIINYNEFTSIGDDFNLILYNNGTFVFNDYAHEEMFYLSNPGDAIVIKLIPKTDKYLSSKKTISIPCATYTTVVIDPIKNNRSDGSIMVIDYNVRDYYVE